MSQTDLDTALREVGVIGRYQIYIYLLLFLPLMVAGVGTMAYVFTSAELRYRCRINECDALNNPNDEYSPDWIRNAIPFDNDKDRLETCYKYNLTRRNLDQLQCEASDFDDRVKIKCNDFVYETDKRSIVNDMDLHCDDNKWKLALVGTLHNAGNFVNLLFCGFFSDKYGRRTVLIFTAVVGNTLGLLRTLSWDYPSFLVMEFIPPALGAGIYTAAFILAVEVVKPEHRAMISAIVFSTTSFGKVILGLSAMSFQDWKTILYVNLPLSYIVLTYYWLMPESLRWQLSHGKFDEAAKSLLKITRVNKTEISPDLRDLLENRPHDLVLNVANETEDKGQEEEATEENKFKLVFRYPKILIRLAACAFCWIIILMVFYGLSLIAVSIGGNKYTDFMLVQFIEIPAALIMPLIANRFGRKKIMYISFAFCGAALIVYTFVGDSYGLKLALFLLGKFAIAIALSNMYIYNSELFPTNLRHTMLGICSGVGRLGSIAAPQAPLLNHYVKNLSMYIFGGGAIIAAVVTLYLPETMNTRLPDTIEEALKLGEGETKAEKVKS